MRTSSEIDKILPALFKVKAELQAVTKDSENPFFKSNYADLNTHLDAVEPLLKKNNLILFQPVCLSTDHSNMVESIIYHTSGQYVSSSMDIDNEMVVNYDKKGDDYLKRLDMQKLGSAITYGRRYTLGALLAMMALDDDANAASGNKTKRTATTKSTSKPSTKKASFDNRTSSVDSI